MGFDLARATTILSRTPEVLDRMLRDLPSDWTHGDEGPDTWSPFDVVGHLVHGERTDWIPRARIILEHGTARTFDPFDRFAQFEANERESMNDRLDLFAQLRRSNLESLENLQISPGQLRLEGRHPEFGVVTLEQLLATWVVHDLGHVAQIVRVMAKSHTDAVGPWQAYLPVLGKREP